MSMRPLVLKAYYASSSAGGPRLTSFALALGLKPLKEPRSWPVVWGVGLLWGRFRRRKMRVTTAMMKTANPSAAAPMPMPALALGDKAVDSGGLGSVESIEVVGSVGAVDIVGVISVLGAADFMGVKYGARNVGVGNVVDVSCGADTAGVGVALEEVDTAPYRPISVDWSMTMMG